MGVLNVPWWEFLERTSAVTTLCPEAVECGGVAVICGALMMECLWCWLVWVLLSSSKICDTKKCLASCVQGPCWPPLGSTEMLQGLRVTFLLFAVTCKLFFCCWFSMILCFSVSLSVTSPSLCFPKHDSTFPFIQGLVDKCVGVKNPCFCAIWKCLGNQGCLAQQTAREAVVWDDPFLF